MSVAGGKEEWRGSNRAPSVLRQTREQHEPSNGVQRVRRVNRMMPISTAPMVT